MQEVRLRVGESYAIKLAGLAGAGLDWTYTVEGDEEAVEISNVALPAPTTQALGTGNREQRLAIHAVGPGKATVRFALRHLYDKSVPPEREELVAVSIRS